MQRCWLCCGSVVAALAWCAIRTEVLTSSARQRGESGSGTEVFHNIKCLCVCLQYFHGFALCSANIKQLGFLALGF